MGSRFRGSKRGRGVTPISIFPHLGGRDKTGGSRGKLGLFDAGGGDAGGGVDYDGVGEEVVETAVVLSHEYHERADGQQGG